MLIKMVSAAKITGAVYMYIYRSDDMKDQGLLGCQLYCSYQI